MITFFAISSAMAGGFGLSLGFENVINDPFVNQYGVRISGAYAPREQLAFECTFAYYPILGGASWKPLSIQLRNENSVAPDISNIAFQAHGRMHIYAIRSEFGSWWGAVDLFGGFGVTKTVDDLVALGTDETDLEAVATKEQWHPSPNWGIAYQLVREVGSDTAIGGRFRWDHFMYIETINSTTLEMKDSGFIGLEAVLWL